MSAYSGTAIVAGTAVQARHRLLASYHWLHWSVKQPAEVGLGHRVLSCACQSVFVAALQLAMFENNL
jgi:hypothetical protein